MLLHDTTIGHIAKLLQMSILTGTDIIDHLRMLKLTTGEGDYLHVEEEYESVFNESIEKMLQNSQQQFSLQEEVADDEG
jgi:hypothetical protein